MRKSTQGQALSLPVSLCSHLLSRAAYSDQNMLLNKDTNSQNESPQEGGGAEAQKEGEVRKGLCSKEKSEAVGACG